MHMLCNALACKIHHNTNLKTLTSGYSSFRCMYICICYVMFWQARFKNTIDLFHNTNLKTLNVQLLTNLFSRMYVCLVGNCPACKILKPNSVLLLQSLWVVINVCISMGKYVIVGQISSLRIMPSFVTRLRNIDKY